MTAKTTKQSTPDSLAEANQTPKQVGYVVNRPYSAGESPEIVTARVKDINAQGFADIHYKTLGGERVDLLNVPFSEGREPGTWHRLP